MVSSQKQVPQCASGEQAAVGRLILLDLSDDRIVSLNSDGSDRKVVVTECRYPDGIALDVAAGHIYWTNMGVPKLNDGSIERADLDGRNRMTIVPQGGTFTPKQLQLEKKSRKLYWCDREGMRVMRANLDGSHIETIVDTSQGDPRPGPDATKWCVGVAVDVDGGNVYWTQKGPDNAGKGRVFRAGIEIPTGQTASKKVPTTPERAAFSAPASKFPHDRLRPIDRISNFFMTDFPSRSTWISISTIALCIGPTGAIRRAATR